MPFLTDLLNTGDSANGIWTELGPTPLAFLEYLLIGVAGLMSIALLNREGIGRAKPT